MSNTVISALVREPTPHEALAEARLGVKDGAQAVMFDMSVTAPEFLTEATFCEMVCALPLPVSFCCYDLSNPTRLLPVDAPMLLAAKAGAAFVDVSPASVAEAKELGAKVIISEHLLDRAASYGESLDIFRRQKAAGADVVKLVARMDTPEEFAEAKRVMAYLRDNMSNPWIYLGLGTLGFAQRFLGFEYGCAVEFALHRPFPGKKDQPLIADFKRRAL